VSEQRFARAARQVVGVSPTPAGQVRHPCRLRGAAGTVRTTSRPRGPRRRLGTLAGWGPYATAKAWGRAVELEPHGDPSSRVRRIAAAPVGVGRVPSPSESRLPGLSATPPPGECAGDGVSLGGGTRSIPAPGPPGGAHVRCSGIRGDRCLLRPGRPVGPVLTLGQPGSHDPGQGLLSASLLSLNALLRACDGWLRSGVPTTPSACYRLQLGAVEYRSLLGSVLGRTDRHHRARSPRVAGGGG
jgi:hypothetical protein